MKKISRLLFMGVLAITLLALMVTPTLGNPNISPPEGTPPPWDSESAQALIDAYNDARRDYDNLYARYRALQEGEQIHAPRPHIVTPQNILVEPGEVREVVITIRNIGNDAAQNFLSTATVSEGAPFIVEFINNSNRFTSLNDNQQRTMTLRITVNSNAEIGATGLISFTHRFSNRAGVHSQTTDTINVRIIGEEEVEGTTNVRLTNLVNSVSNLGPDQNFNVTATLQNTGTAPAHSVSINIANMDAAVLLLTSDLNDASFPVLEPGESRQVSFSFRTRDVASTFTTVNFRVSYDEAAENRPLTPFPVTIIAIPEDYADTSPNIELRGLTVPTGRLNVGQAGQISFELVNTGDAEARNISVSVSSMVAGALVPTTLDRQNIQSLEVGGVQAFTFGFMPTSSAETRNYPVQIRIEYQLPSTGTPGTGAPGTNGGPAPPAPPTPFVQYVGLNVYNPEDEDDDRPDEPEGRQIPRIIVSEFTLYPQIPRAGQNFEMEITFMNTSSTRAVNNIRIILDAPPPATGGPGGTGVTGGDSVFTPVGGSNTLFVSDLAPGETMTRTVTMFTVPDAAPRIYSLRINLDYQDEDFDLHAVTELLSIPVAQDSRLETRPPEVFIMPFMDMFGFVDFEFDIINSGRVNLRNLRIRVDGNFDTHQADDYLGNLQQGRVVNFRGRIFPSEPGLQEGAIVISAEDDAGEIVEIVHPFVIDVMGGFGDEFHFEDDWGEGGGRFPGEFDMGDHFPGEFDMGDRFPGDYGFDDGEQGGIFSRMWGFMRRPVFWGPAAGVVVAAIIIIVMLVKRKNSRLDFED